MLREAIISILFTCFLTALSYSQPGGRDQRLREIVKMYGQAEVTVPFAGNELTEELTRHVSILNVKDGIIEISISPVTVEWFIWKHLNYTVKERMFHRGLLQAADMSKALTWEMYPSYTQYDSIMLSFAENYPALCRLDTIGTSTNGKLVLALGITGDKGEDDLKPEVFYTSTMHGDETGGFILMLRLADFLLKGYGIDDRITGLLDNLKVWINPLANPDGTYNNGNIISSPVRYNANGIDLNRNFPDPLFPDRGIEKENQDMIRFMRGHRFVISANFHSGVEVVNYPWDRWLSVLHADDDWFHGISRAYADTVHQHAARGYMDDLDNGVTRGAVWYVVRGGRQDFVTQELHGREVTIELDDLYITPVDQLGYLWEYNWRSLLGYIENATFGIHGLVLDADTNSPVPAEIFIRGHDADSSQVYADTLTGRFVRLISPAVWPLTLTAEGYRDTTFSVTVYDREKTDLTVYMKKGSSDHDTLPETPSLYPNPVQSILHAVLPELLEGYVDVRLLDQQGRIVRSYAMEYFPGVPMEINVAGLSPGTYTADFRNKVRNKSCRGRFIVIK